MIYYFRIFRNNFNYAASDTPSRTLAISHCLPALCNFELYTPQKIAQLKNHFVSILISPFCNYFGLYLRVRIKFTVTLLLLGYSNVDFKENFLNLAHNTTNKFIPGPWCRNFPATGCNSSPDG